MTFFIKRICIFFFAYHGQKFCCRMLLFHVWCNDDAFLYLKTEGIQYSGAYASMGVDNSLRMDNFCKNFKIEIKRLTEDEMEFDMIGIDASIANAFRRILIAEVCAVHMSILLQSNRIWINITKKVNPSNLLVLALCTILESLRFFTLFLYYIFYLRLACK